jgi:hypothetical protein
MPAVALLLAVTVPLSACSAPVQPDVLTRSNSVAPEQTLQSTLPLSGEFVSQGAETRGTVTIAQTSATEFTITLTDFSTGEGADLRPWLSSGVLTKGPDGAFWVDSDSQLELPGNIDPSGPDQSFVFPLYALDSLEPRSFTVYNYADRIAFGSASLEER